MSYVANVTFGTPPQHFLTYIETWGNGCWLTGVDNYFCELYTDQSSCGGYGGYNLTASTTATKLDEKLAYNDHGDITNGDFVTDVLRIGNATIDAMKMGVVGGDATTDSRSRPS